MKAPKARVPVMQYRILVCIGNDLLLGFKGGLSGS